jgi:hypothetical protein
VTEGQMAERIVEFVRDRPAASSPEIMGAVGPESKGKFEWSIAPNTVLWVGLSEKIINAFRLVKDRVRPHPSDALVYLMDGAALTLPIAKRLTKQGCKKPHWSPVVFHVPDK